ncbi:NAD(P)/FAD-dependent oxidoreductase [Viridibacillus sp. FSL E2-0187]|uniref:NAD(P)/FAD-dependent oxidoreductase n=1 Tax=Viridibacillus TaxID=496496 RepID=UPI00187B8B2F|nr:NAD(P)/FAD-dependent oxidoreductase [Viridibacillus sp. JNUCC-6]QOV13144.1 NAD(P)/FAD-dependent oxidoreductase [Viridibacillus sp. JNUCC-6]
MNRPKILILGAGYGGLTTAVNLQKKIGSNVADITIVNKNSYHYESTWLHEASAGTLSPEKVRYDIQSVLNNKVNFVQAAVESIDATNKKVITDAGEMSYDYLVVGLGFEGETFGIEGLDKFAFGISDVNEARKLRDHINSQFAEWASQAPAEKDDTLLTIVVGGAGFTGIEFLGELANRIPELCKEYDAPQEKVRVICVEAAPTVLPMFSRELVEYAVGYLTKKGIEFSIGTPVVQATPEGVKIKKGEEEFEFIKAGTVVWAAGVRGSRIVEESDIPSKRARVAVDKDLRVPGFPEVFIVGDCAFLMNEEAGRPYPTTAQIAMQQAITVAENLIALIEGKDTKEFVPALKGTVCSLGDSDAIGEVFGKEITGKPASFMKKVIDNRALYMVGGAGLVLKKGKFNVL